MPTYASDEAFQLIWIRQRIRVRVSTLYQFCAFYEDIFRLLLKYKTGIVQIWSQQLNTGNLRCCCFLFFLIKQIRVIEIYKCFN